MSSSLSPRQSPEQEDKPKPHKIFVTNPDVEISTSKLEAELQEKFYKFGKLGSVVVKKSFNNEYSFAFIEYLEGEDASDTIKELNNSSLYGKKMKVEFQESSCRRKGGNETCFVCGKVGHYARNCRQNKNMSRSAAIPQSATVKRARSTDIEAAAAVRQERRNTQRSIQRRQKNQSTRKGRGRVLALRSDLIP